MPTRPQRVSSPMILLSIVKSFSHSNHPFTKKYAIIPTALSSIVQRTEIILAYSIPFQLRTLLAVSELMNFINSLKQ